MSIPVHVVEVSWATHGAVLIDVRRTVFIDEQRVPEEEELDGRDDSATHFIALTETGQAVGCARLLPSGQIGRMAVLKPWRGTGLGRALLDAAVAAGQARGEDRLFLHAQEYAEPFYRKAGFVVNGARFMDAGIAHLPMELKLPLAFEPPPGDLIEPVVRAASAPRDGRVSDPHEFADPQQAVAGLLATISASRRELCILSPFLDHTLFDVPEVVDAISEFARHAPRATVRILIMSSKLIVDRGHRLVDLSRRLDDKIKIRRYDEEISEDTSSILCGDLDAYWLQPNHEQYQGVWDLLNPITCQRLRGSFQQAWERGRLDPDLRILRI